MNLASLLSGKNKYIFMLVAIIILVAIFSLLQRSRASPSKLTFMLGVGTHGNISSEEYALSSGVRYYRNDITFNSTQISQISQEASKYNARYLGILDYDTLPGGIYDKNWTLAEWNASVANALREYPEISTWEIWNEPLVPLFDTGLMNGSAYNYFILTESAYKIIKAAEPNSTVVCFGGAPIYDSSVFLWYSKVWSYGASKYCDAISIHAYPSNSSLSHETKQQWAYGLQAYENLTGKPIWITEMGVPASSQAYPSLYTPEGQEAFMQQSLSFLSNFSYVKAVYWYDLWGLSDGQEGNDFGLLNLSNPSGGRPGPAWYAFLSDYNNSLSK